LRELFDYLYENLSNDENINSLSLTKRFCDEKKIDFEKVKEWAADLGGFDDAEILWNVEEQYEFLY
jgi:hypothetical protein